MGYGTNAVITLGFAILCVHCGRAAETLLQPVTNLEWISFNFRTILQWKTTSTGSAYTVRIRGIKTDWKSKPECTHIEGTSCDLTSLMQNVTDKYIAEVLTYSVEFKEEDTEPPVAESTPIQLLSQTDIGEANFHISQNSSHEVQILMEDPVTGIRFSNNTPKTLRDIYGPNLQYKVTYWKDGTSGQRSEYTKNQMLLIKVDEGVNYCFSVQIKISSLYRFGSKSQHNCTNVQNAVYGLGFYALVIIGTVAVISIIIGVTVCLCRRKAAHSSAETNPLKVVSM